jgi:hypothetical protein
MAARDPTKETEATKEMQIIDQQEVRYLASLTREITRVATGIRSKAMELDPRNHEEKIQRAYNGVMSTTNAMLNQLGHLKSNVVKLTESALYRFPIEVRWKPARVEPSHLAIIQEMVRQVQVLQQVAEEVDRSKKTSEEAGPSQ